MIQRLPQMWKPFCWILVLGLLGPMVTFAEERDPTFDVVALGTRGGVVDDNLTAFMVGERGGTEYVLLDGGTVIDGLTRALEKGNLTHLSPGKTLHIRPLDILRNHVKAVMISHPHLDHVSGFVMATPGDTEHPIYGLDETLNDLRDHLFNWVLWPNFTNEGENPLNKYTLQRLSNAGPMEPIPDTRLKVQAFRLSHSKRVSTAFLVEHANGDSVLFLGDTGPDAAEDSSDLANLWKAVAPRIRAGTLRGLFLECSYPDPRAENLLFGHLTPIWFMRELNALAKIVGPAPEGAPSSLAGLPVVVIGIKPALLPDGPGDEPESAAARIRRQLDDANDVGVRLLHPEPGSLFGL